MNADKGKQVVNLTPHTITVRDDQGRIIGCLGLAKLTHSSGDV